MEPHEHLPDLAALMAQSGPLLFHWPMPGDPGALVTFENPSRWREFILSMGVHPSLPEIVRTKFSRAQKLYFLGWLDIDLVKAGELAALVALELALKDRYLGKIKASLQANHKKSPRIFLHHMLIHMVENDGLTNEKLPIFRRTGGNPIARIVGGSKPSLADIRNSLAHGDPFDRLPQAGLLELVRDLINFAYRQWIKESPYMAIPTV